MKIEQLITPGKIEVREDDGKRMIVGYASVFYNGKQGTEFELMPGLVERVMPGAFTKALRGKRDVVALFNHEEGRVLGRRSAGTLRLSQDETGLRYEIDAPNHADALLESISRGDISGSSIGFRVAPRGERIKRSDGLTVREITEVGALRDVGPVTFPAFEGTSAAVRGIDEKRLAAEVRALMAREVAIRIRLIEVAEQNFGG